MSTTDDSTEAYGPLCCLLAAHHHHHRPMGYFRVRCTKARTCAATQQQLPEEHDFTDAVYVFATTEHGARAAALATWPSIRHVLSVQEQFFG